MKKTFLKEKYPRLVSCVTGISTTIFVVTCMIACNQGKTGTSQKRPAQSIELSGTEKSGLRHSSSQFAHQGNKRQKSEKALIADELFEQGKYVYLYFYDESDNNCILQNKLLDKALPDLEPKVQVVRINREDSKNSRIVKVFKANRVEVPFFVLYTPDRYPIRKLQGVQASQSLLHAIPSPAQEKVIQAYRQRKLSLLCFYREDMKEFDQVNRVCQAVVRRMSGLVEYFAIDMKDKRETNFMHKMNVYDDETRTTVIVVNLKGRGNTRFKGEVDENQLLETVKREYANSSKTKITFR